MPEQDSLLREHDPLMAYALAGRENAAAPLDLAPHLLRLAETTPDFVATADVEGHVLYLNPAARRMLGLAPDAPVTLLHLADLHPVWASVLVLGAGIEMALLDGAWRGEAALVTCAREEIPVSEVIIASPGSAGGPVLLTLVARDISELKQTETALRASEQFYRRMVETANVGIWIIDAENRVTFVNPPLAKCLGYHPEEMTGQPLETFLDSPSALCNVQERCALRLRRKDGGRVWIALSTSPLFDADERYAGVLGIVTYASPSSN